LEKCLHGETQNVNESFNQLIWKRCPKTIFVGKQIVDIAAASSVLQFNDGGKGIANVLKALKLKSGVYVKRGLLHSTMKRIVVAEGKSSEKTKLQRKNLSSEKKGFKDKTNEEEGEVYSAGAFP
jgi:hypothetical protein